MFFEESDSAGTRARKLIAHFFHLNEREMPEIERLLFELDLHEMLIGHVRQAYEAVQHKSEHHTLYALRLLLKLLDRSKSEESGPAAIVAKFFIEHCREAVLAEGELRPIDYVTPMSIVETPTEMLFGELYRYQTRRQAILFRELKNSIKQSYCFVSPTEEALKNPQSDPLVCTIAWLGQSGFDFIQSLLATGQVRPLGIIKGLARIRSLPLEADCERLFEICKRINLSHFARAGLKDAVVCCRLFDRPTGGPALAGRMSPVLYPYEKSPEGCASDLLTAMEIARFIPLWGSDAMQRRIEEASEDPNLSEVLRREAAFVAKERKKLPSAENHEELEALFLLTKDLPVTC